MSSTMSAVLDMGDMMQSRVINRERVRQAARPAPVRPTGRPSTKRRSKVMGLEEWEKTGVLKQHKPPRRRWWPWVLAIVLIVVAAGLILALAPAARRFLFGP